MEQLTPAALAAQLHGRTYRNEVTKDHVHAAFQAGLVIIFGYSDDNVEIRGASDDEIGARDGTEIFFTRSGLLRSECENHRCPYHEKEKRESAKVKAFWDAEGYDWMYTTEIPHATFDIVEGEEKYCRGIVFALADVGTK